MEGASIAVTLRTAKFETSGIDVWGYAEYFCITVVYAGSEEIKICYVQ